MIIYLAGVLQAGNLRNMFLYIASLSQEKNRVMKLFLASTGSVEIKGEKSDYVIKESIKKNKEIYLKDLFILESYHYITKQEWMFPLFKEFKGFLLDSGAFTFMTSMKGQKVNWEQYVINYGNFIKQNDIKNFFELDIDPIVGLKEVERLRNLLEETAQRKCIPVWHKSRGLEYWKQMCKEYDYVAIGGIVTQEIKRSEYDVFFPLLKIARENNCKVHGLGFTNLKGMEKYKFYSVDSTSWLSGNKFGAVYLFDGKTMIKQKKKEGQRVKTNEVAIHNFSEWVKFSKYAEGNL